MEKLNLSEGKEIWKDIPGWEDYSVSSFGNVWSKKANKIISFKVQKRNEPAYLICPLSKSKKRKFFYVHQLVLLAFEGPMKEGHDEILHIDDNPKNNKLSNIRYGTHKENMQDCISKGRMAFQNLDKFPDSKKPLPPIKQKGMKAARGSLDALKRTSDLQKRAIIMTDSEGTDQTYSSISEAARALQTSPGNIGNLIREKRKTKKGYTFRYAD